MVCFIFTSRNTHQFTMILVVFYFQFCQYIEHVNSQAASYTSESRLAEVDHYNIHVLF